MHASFYVVVVVVNVFVVRAAAVITFILLFFRSLYLTQWAVFISIYTKLVIYQFFRWQSNE